LGLTDGVGVHEVIEAALLPLPGIKAGDVIIEVDGKFVKEVTHFNASFRIKPADVKDEIFLMRIRKRTATVKLVKSPIPKKEAKVTPDTVDEAPDKLG